MMPGRASPQPPPLQLIIALALLTLITTSIVAARVEPLDPGRSCCDMLFYRSMAFNLIRVTRPALNQPPPGIRLEFVYDDPYFGKYYKAENQLNRQPPYVYRPAAPLLARMLESIPRVGIDLAFRSLAFLSLWGAAFFTGLTILSVSGSIWASASAVVTLSALYRITPYHLWNYTMADPLAMALLALAVWLIFQRRDRWFLAVAVPGLFAKETFALALISFVLFLVIERRLERRIVLGLSGVVAAYILYRLSIPIPNNSLTLSNAYVGLPGMSDTLDIAFGVFGPLSLFAVMRIWFNREALFLTPLIVGVYVLAMLTPDRERLFVYAFPALTIAVFAHPVRNRLALAALTMPALLTFLFTQLDALPGTITVDTWMKMSYLAIVIIEPVFIFSSRLWERSPLVPPLSRTPT